MLQMINKKNLLSYSLLALSINAYAAELLLGQVPEVAGKTPVFHQDASASSKPVTSFQPKQTVQILTQKKEWSKVAPLDQSGNTGWVLTDQLGGLTKLKVELNQNDKDKTYHCYVRIQDPKGRSMGSEKLEKAVREYNKAMGDLFRNVFEEFEVVPEKLTKETSTKKEEVKQSVKGN